MNRRRLGLLLLLAAAVFMVAGCSSTTGQQDITVQVGDGQASNGNGQLALSVEMLIALTVL